MSPKVLSVEGTINETSYSQELDFTLDCGIDEKFTMLLLRWDNGNMAILGSSLQTVYISETLIEKRINEEAFNVGVSCSCLSRSNNFPAFVKNFGIDKATLLLMLCIECF